MSEPVDGEVLNDPEGIAQKIRSKFPDALPPNKQLNAIAYLAVVPDDRDEKRPGKYDGNHWNVMHGNTSRVVIFKDEHGKDDVFFCYDFGQEGEDWNKT